MHINKINFIYNEPNYLGSGYMCTSGLVKAFRKLGVLHYAFDTTGPEFLNQDELRRYPIFYIRGFLQGRKPMVDAGGEQFKATLQSESYFTRHGKLDVSSTMIRERESLFDLMITFAETDETMYKIPTHWMSSWADITVLDHVKEPTIKDKLGFVGGLRGREDWHRQDRKGVIQHMHTELHRNALVNAQRYTDAINQFQILVAPPGRMFNSMTGRVFEIMACKRLCLAYANPDTMFKHMELFEDGVDIVYWTTFEEMVEKFNYYKEHDEERERIALSGYNKIREFHNQDIAAKYISDLILEHANKLCLTI